MKERIDGAGEEGDLLIRADTADLVCEAIPVIPLPTAAEATSPADRNVNRISLRRFGR